MKGILISLLVGAVLLLGITIAQAETEALPCGFQRLADTCARYPATEEGAMGHEFLLEDTDGVEWLLVIGYVPGDFVGFIIGPMGDDERAPLALFYNIGPKTFILVDYDTGVERLKPPEEACFLMDLFWETFGEELEKRVAHDILTRL